MIEYGTRRHPTAVANEAQLFWWGWGGVGDWKEKWAGKKTNRCDSDEVKENVKESRKSQERESAVYYDCSGVVKARSPFSGQFY